MTIKVNNAATVNIKDSIATRLLAIVFSIYFIITLIVTVSHMTAEYYKAKSNIAEELVFINSVFSESLADAIWSFNEDQIKSILIGIIKMPVVIGIKIMSPDNKSVINQIGTIIDDGKIVTSKISDAEKPDFPEAHSSNNVFWHHADITFTTDKNVQERIANVYFYSSYDIVFDRVKLGFLFIIVNAIIKTIALWIIFLVVSRHLLSKPLAIINHATQSVDLDNLNSQKLNVNTHGNNELKLIEQAFNDMIDKLGDSKSNLEQLNQKYLVERNRAEESCRAKTCFLMNMSHELRTPLNAIICYSEMIYDELIDSTTPELLECREDVKNITHSGMHLLTVFNDIIDMSCIESGTFQIKPQKIDICEFIKPLQNQIQENLTSKSNQLTVNCPATLGTMVTDPKCLLNILMKLLDNACKFTQNGSISIKVEKLEQHGLTTICFGITDTGIGIAPEQVKLIFTSFCQLDNSTTRKHGGLGIGLNIVQRICSLLAGKLTVTSELNSGSTFTLSLPQDINSVDCSPQTVGRSQLS